MVSLLGGLLKAIYIYYVYNSNNNSNYDNNNDNNNNDKETTLPTFFKRLFQMFLFFLGGPFIANPSILAFKWGYPTVFHGLERYGHGKPRVR